MVLPSQVLIALALTLVGGGSTALGGLLVVLQPKPDMGALGLLQGFAAGLMFSLSFFDLMPNAINAVGFLSANVWFFGGAGLFAAIVQFIPEPQLGPAPEQSRRDRGKDASLGGGSMGLLAGRADSIVKKRQRQQVLFSGIVTAVGIAIHNFPEGVAVFLGSLKGLRVGASLAFAIALHNIPEGIAVALPIYFATGKRWQAFRWAALSGLAEPLGVVVVALLFPNNLSEHFIEGMLGGVGGIMAFLTLNEMLPLAFEYAGHRMAIASLFLGMAVMSASLQFLAMVMPAEVSI
eukprot:TRINITY_DN5510_c0_g3_i1.p1 TRINITY_DN5510_c0_g3~~TRINITY_DN5510_c0_g3_i1.p1  ORF type:complete len:292 (+),score=80.58 TRINITY_DN5510_c0_g3_i1:319-1194(+)